MFLAAACVLFGTASVAGAAEVVTARVDRVEERYHVDFVVLLDGEADRLVEIITDYERLQDLSPSVVSSRLLSGRDGADARVEVILRPCVLIVFCKKITKVSDSYVEADPARVQYITVPGLSDFQAGRETITVVTADGNGGHRARFTYAAVLKPDFYVPPFVGTWLIRRAIIRDLETTTLRVERLLQRGDP